MYPQYVLEQHNDDRGTTEEHTETLLAVGSLDSRASGTQTGQG